MKTKTLPLFLLTLLLLVTVRAQTDDPEVNRLGLIVSTTEKLNALPISFQLASVNPDSASAANLQQSANLLKQMPAGTIIEIGAYTDPGGNEGANLKLTASRAAAVRSELIRLGVSGASLVANGYGSSVPAIDVYKGRRVVFIVAKMAKSPASAGSANVSANQENAIIPGKGWKNILLGASLDAVTKQLGAPENSLRLPPEPGKPTYQFLNYYSAGIMVSLANNIATIISFDMDYVKSNPKIKPFAGKTDKGIGAGAKVDDVIRAHGAADKIETKTLSSGEVRTFVRYPKTTFAFIGDRSTGKLASISLSSE